MHHFRWEILNFWLSVIQKFVSKKWIHWRRIARPSSLSSEFVFMPSTSVPSLSFFSSLCSPHFSPSFTLFLSFTPYISWWLTCVSVMSLTPSFSLCLTAPFRSTSLTWNNVTVSPPHPFTNLTLLYFRCCACLPTSTHIFYLFIFYISCQSVVALGVSVFCWSVIFRLLLTVSLPSPRLFVSPLDSGRLIIFVEQQCAFVSSD